MTEKVDSSFSSSTVLEVGKIYQIKSASSRRQNYWIKSGKNFKALKRATNQFAPKLVRKDVFTFFDWAQFINADSRFDSKGQPLYKNFIDVKSLEPMLYVGHLQTRRSDNKYHVFLYKSRLVFAIGLLNILPHDVYEECGIEDDEPTDMSHM